MPEAERPDPADEPTRLLHPTAHEEETRVGPPLLAQARPLRSRLVDGRFELLSELGRGGMGVVYRARDRDAGREVALKLLHARELTPDQLERFRREGQLAAALDHPGIVRVHSAGEAEGRPYLVYERVEGARSLDAHWEGLPLLERVALVEQAAGAVASAHAQGIVHRDLKPANILVDAAGAVRVTDLGLALAPGLERLTHTGTALGTPAFMSPEQLEGAPLGPTTDVWSLGVILYQALTDRRPFRGDTPLDLAQAIRSVAPRRPRALRPELPQALEATCLRALAKLPGARHPDAGAFQEALGAARRLPARPAPALRWPVAAGILSVTSLAFALTQVGAPAPRPLPPASASPDPSVDPDDTPSADAAWLALSELRDPRRRLDGAEAWLAAHPGHPQGARLRTLLRRAARQQPLSRFSHPEVQGARFLGPDGARVLTWDSEGRVRTWERAGGQPRLLGEVDGATCAAVSPDGAQVALGGNNRVAVLATEGFGLLGRIQSPRHVHGLVYAPGGRRLAFGGEFSQVYVVQPPAGRDATRLGLHASPVRALGFSRDGRWLVSLCGTASLGPEQESSVRLWDWPARRLVARAPLTARPTCLSFAPDGRSLVVGESSGAIYQFRVPDLNLIRHFVADPEQTTGLLIAHFSSVSGLRFSPDGRLLYSTSTGRAWRGTRRSDLRVWEVAGGRLVGRHFSERARLSDLDLSRDGSRLLVTLAEEGAAELWHSAAFGASAESRERSDK